MRNEWLFERVGSVFTLAFLPHFYAEGPIKSARPEPQLACSGMIWISWMQPSYTLLHFMFIATMRDVAEREVTAIQLCFARKATNKVVEFWIMHQIKFLLNQDHSINLTINVSDSPTSL